MPLFLLLGVLPGTAQDSTPRRSAHVAYDAEMSQVGQDCPSQIEVADRNDCLEDVRVQSYKNFDTFYAGLREVLIDQAPNDSNALELDAAERAWEAERTKTCDAVSQTYDLGTVKHPGSTQPSARARCLIQLTRSRMRDLMQLYEPSL
ncbi:MAG TPA: lysozyme inhibitor LprI family protein [Acidobacteriaceae bacterium]|nr:lysozyme inhibitor LprI family protein [Acidobacteriaceae bacterium]